MPTIRITIQTNRVGTRYRFIDDLSKYAGELIQAINEVPTFGNIGSIRVTEVKIEDLEPEELHR